MMKRNIAKGIVNGVTGDIMILIMQIFLCGLLIRLLVVTIIRLATSLEAEDF